MLPPFNSKWSNTHRKMADDYTIPDPDLVEVKTVDDQGRVTIGAEFAGEEVKVAVLRKNKEEA